MNKVQNKDCIEYYKDFLENYFMQYTFNDNADDVSQYLKDTTLVNIKNNEFAFEDLAPLMYIQYKTFGIKDKCQIKHVVIDEAQDYGEFQFDVLKSILKKQFYDNFGRYSSGGTFLQRN